LPPEVQADFISKGGPKLQSHLQRSSGRHKLAPGIILGGQTILRSADGFYLEKPHSKICDPIVIERILCQQDGTRWLAGKVEREPGPRKFVVEECKASKDGLLATINAQINPDNLKVKCKWGWNQRVLEIALAIHQPTIVTDVDVVGWDGHAFRFPN